MRCSTSGRGWLRASFEVTQEDRCRDLIARKDEADEVARTAREIRGIAIVFLVLEQHDFFKRQLCTVLSPR